ncbi:EAL domain-containing protein [Jannaschia sp. Os4]|uniref:sensor domain-containing phosphodiesterase n=1 Tax=Jannaschia sp. Os4 TaxID=2807617 RepID=UPI00193ACADC|nr:EAL domain-containing protein [Jannaschia sp. Os4]MBM2576688.1 EAL domain-containing protein [Jannaschia sp. Os4]
MLQLPIPRHGARPAAGDDVILRALRGVRTHLGMPIAYLSEFEGEETVFRHVDAPGLESLIAAGDRKRLSEVYCTHILRGDLPELIPDTAALPLAQDMPITTAAPIGSHVSVPVTRSDGSIYGMFCCLSPEPNPSLNPRDLEVMKMFAGLAADQVQETLRHDDGVASAAARVRALLGGSGLRAEAQPIYDLGTGTLAGFEALARFDGPPERGPLEWFADASVAGLRRDLEIAAAHAALDLLPGLPDGAALWINADAATLDDPRFLGLVTGTGAPPGRLVVEVTEHRVLDDPARATRAVARLRGLGLRVAIDDVGAGHAGLSRILELRPDILKLDRMLVHGIDLDPVRQAMAEAVIGFARRCDMDVVAEGIERDGELDALRDLGASHGQGFHLGRPGAVRDARARLP